MNIAKHIHYWTATSDEDWDVAVDLVEQGKVRHGLFFLHLAMEKMIKAHVCRHTEQVPTKSHNLLWLAEKADISLSEEWLELLGMVNDFCLTGRYPDDPSIGLVPKSMATKYVRESQELREWLRKKLSES